VEPEDAEAAPTCALVAEVTVPIAGELEPLTGIRNKA